MKDSKTCPHCKGVIKAAAIKCKHCKSNISESNDKKKSNNSNNEIRGYIGYYKLAGWWLSAFTESEREYIKKKYTPMTTEKISVKGSSLTEGVITYSDAYPAKFLSSLATWFKSKDDKKIAFKIIEKAEELLGTNNSILDEHFLYSHKIEIYYKNREDVPKALDIAIDACKRQIEIAPQAKKAFLRNYKDSILPAHVGYKQLAIIEEKQKNYVEAIRICSEAMGQGWGGDWQKRVERCKKKIQK